MKWFSNLSGKGKIGVVIAALFGCGLVSTLMSPSKTAPPVAQAPAPGETAAPTVPPTEAPAAPAFSEIAKFRKTATDAQWDPYAAKLKGNVVTDWPGLIMEVTTSGENFNVSVDFDRDEFFNVSDTTITTSDKTAMSFHKEDKVLVSGTIEEVSSPLGTIVISFKDGATVKPAK